MDYGSGNGEASVPLLASSTAPSRQQQQQQQEAAAPRKRSKLLTVCPFILGNEFCER